MYIAYFLVLLRHHHRPACSSLFCPSFFRRQRQRPSAVVLVLVVVVVHCCCSQSQHYIDPDAICCVVLDEAHHCGKEHPFNRVARSFLTMKAFPDELANPRRAGELPKVYFVYVCEVLCFSVCRSMHGNPGVFLLLASAVGIGRDRSCTLCRSGRDSRFEHATNRCSRASATSNSALTQEITAPPRRRRQKTVKTCT